MANTHEVVHKGFYRRVNGQLTALPIGTKLELSKEQGERMTKSGLVKPLPVAKQELRPVKDPDPEMVKDPDPEVKQKKPKTAKGRRSKK